MFNKRGRWSMSEFWVKCNDCDFLRHGSNSPMLKTLHEENNLGHFCLVLEGSPTKPYKYCMFKCQPYDSDVISESEHWNKFCLGNPQNTLTQESQL